MKKCLIIYLLVCFQTAYSETNKYQSIKTDKLYITAKTYDNKQENWLKVYPALGSHTEKLIPISVNINIKHVKRILISDVNAINNICGKTQLKHLVFMSFDKPLNDQQSITTKINLPCLDNFNARFKITVETQNGKRFYNINTYKAHPDVISTVHTEDE